MFDDIHNGVMHNPIRIERKAVYLAFFWFVHFEDGIFRRFESAVGKVLMQTHNVCVAVGEELFNARLTRFPAHCFIGCELQISNVDYLVK